MSREATLIDLAPGVPAEDAVELLGVTFEQLKAELEFRARARQAKCLKEIALAAKNNGARKLLRGDGGGQVEMMIHPTSYHYWGQRLGYQCWDDPAFRREYRRDVEASRVKTINDRLTIVKPDLAPNKPARRRGPTGRHGRWAA